MLTPPPPGMPWEAFKLWILHCKCSNDEERQFSDSHRLSQRIYIINTTIHVNISHVHTIAKHSVFIRTKNTLIKDTCKIKSITALETKMATQLANMSGLPLEIIRMIIHIQRVRRRLLQGACCHPLPGERRNLGGDCQQRFRALC